MARWSGIIGFVTTLETKPGIWEEVQTERIYIGDVLNTSVRRQNSGKVIDDISITNRISFLSDIYADSNIYAMKYIQWQGSFWEVQSVDITYPRLTVNLGGVYHGPTL